MICLILGVPNNFLFLLKICICGLSHKVRAHYSTTGGILYHVFYAQRNVHPIFYVLWLHYSVILTLILGTYRHGDLKCFDYFYSCFLEVEYVKETLSEKF